MRMLLRKNYMHMVLTATITIVIALDKVVKNAEYEVEKAYVFANCDVTTDDKYLYMPIYMCAFVSNEVELPVLKPITLT